MRRLVNLFATLLADLSRSPWISTPAAPGLDGASLAPAALGVSSSWTSGRARAHSRVSGAEQAQPLTHELREETPENPVNPVRRTLRTGDLPRRGRDRIIDRPLPGH